MWGGGNKLDTAAVCGSIDRLSTIDIMWTNISSLFKQCMQCIDVHENAYVQLYPCVSHVGKRNLHMVVVGPCTSADIWLGLPLRAGHKTTWMDL